MGDGDAEKRLTDFVEEMAGKDINEVMAAGHEKLATIPMGGGGGGGGAVPALLLLPVAMLVAMPRRRSPPPTTAMPAPLPLVSSTTVVTTIKLPQSPQPGVK